MKSLRPLHVLFQLAIGTVVLALIVRTCLIMGLVMPMQVTGSSMAPTLRGEHVLLACPECGETVPVAAEFTQGLSHATCPRCGEREIALQQAAIRPGDQLVIDRQSLAWRRAERGEIVVLRNPSDGQQLSVKRVWGLPGETIKLHEGDLLVDGHTLAKSLDLQRTLRRLVHREQEQSKRWTPDPGSLWKWNAEGWAHAMEAPDGVSWLRYQHPVNQPITDDYFYNANLTRRLHSVRDFMLAAEVFLAGHGKLALSLEESTQAPHIRLSFDERGVSVQLDSVALQKVGTPQQLQGNIQGRWVRLELSNFDRQLLLAIDSQVVLQANLPIASPSMGTSSPFAIGVSQLDVKLRNLEIYRDVYFTSQAVGMAPVSRQTVELGPREYFLLGDNSPVSVDSRSWGGIPQRLFVGRPLGVR